MSQAAVARRRKIIGAIVGMALVVRASFHIKALIGTSSRMAAWAAIGYGATSAVLSSKELGGFGEGFRKGAAVAAIAVAFSQYAAWRADTTGGFYHSLYQGNIGAQLGGTSGALSQQGLSGSSSQHLRVMYSTVY